MRNLVLLAAGLIILSSVLFLETQTVDILYFRHPTCRLINESDYAVETLQSEFGRRISVRTINVKMEETDPEDTVEIKQLREKYDVKGVPVIIINGKEFVEEITKDNLKEAICDELLLKPGVCG